MDKKYLMTMAAAAAMFAACSDDVKETLGGLPDGPKSPVAVVSPDSIPVGFDAYANRATTRAGKSGDSTNETLQKGEEEGGGFGVFGYYTDNNDYDQLATPNFMYNQLVKYDNGSWKYEPVRYWPNEYGSSAVSDDYDKVSFFAYAPYVTVNGASGKVTDTGNADWGITQISRNTASGDPIVKYIASFKQNEAVDLLWAVSEETNWGIVEDGSIQEFTPGMPWLDVKRPAQINQRLKFNFRHALAKMRVNVDAVADQFEGKKSADEKTRIWIRSVRFNGFAMKGALNLNNENANTPYWMNYNGIGDLEADGDVMVYDGRRDGKEAMSNAKATNEKSLGLNPKFIEDDTSFYDGSWATGENNTGVDGTTSPLFDGGGIFYVIPLDDDEVNVEIVYDVETIDKNMGYTLADGKTPGTAVENRISKVIKFAPSAGSSDAVTSIEAGKSYQINLHLGMNSVKFDAEVMAWEELEPATEINLPANMPQLAIGSDHTITVPADARSYTFALTGLNVGETITTDTPTNSADDGVVGVSSVDVNAQAKQTWEIVKINLNPNETVKTQTTTFNIAGSANSTGSTITIVQQPHALGLAVAVGGVKSGESGEENNTIKLTSTAKKNAFKAVTLTGDNIGISIIKNGVEQTLVSGDSEPDDAKEFTFTPFDNESAATIKFHDNIVAGDTYIITVKAGDAEAETYTVRVGGVRYQPTAATIIFGESYEEKAKVFGEALNVKYADNTEASNVYGTINPTTGTITKKENATSTVTPDKFTVTCNGDDNPDTGWFFTKASKESAFELTVELQPATISFAKNTVENTITATEIASDAKEYEVQPLTYTGVISGNIDSYTENQLGTVSYTITDDNASVFENTIPDGKIKLKNGTHAGTYSAVIHAKIQDGTGFKYEIKEITYTFTVKVE